MCYFRQTPPQNQHLSRRKSNCLCANMTARLRRHIPSLKLLHKAKPNLVKAIINNSSDDLIKCVCDCALNLLKGNVEITECWKGNLLPHKTTLRQLTKPISITRKRKLIQKGRFLSTLLGAVIPAILAWLGV